MAQLLRSAVADHLPLPGFTISEPTSAAVRFEVMSLQLAALSVVLKTPAPKVPAKTVAGFAGSTARTAGPRGPKLGSTVKPELAATQLAPPSVVLKTPAVPVPMSAVYKIFELTGSIARALLMMSVNVGRPEFTATQDSPPF